MAEHNTVTITTPRKGGNRLTVRKISEQNNIPIADVQAAFDANPDLLAAGIGGPSAAKNLRNGVSITITRSRDLRPGELQGPAAEAALAAAAPGEAVNLAIPAGGGPVQNLTPGTAITRTQVEIDAETATRQAGEAAAAEQRRIEGVAKQASRPSRPPSTSSTSSASGGGLPPLDAPLGSAERTAQLTARSEYLTGLGSGGGTSGQSFRYVDKDGNVKTFQAANSDEALKNLPSDAAPTSGVQSVGTNALSLEEEVGSADPKDTARRVNAGSGINTDSYDPDDAVKFTQDLYNDQLDAHGVATAKLQLETLGKELEDLRNERDGKIADINENPWLSEGVRVARVNKLTERFEDREGNLLSRLNLTQAIYESGIQQAQFATSTAVNAYFASANLQQDWVFNQMDIAERANLEATRQLEVDRKFGRDILESDRDFELDVFDTETRRISATKKGVSTNQSALFSAKEELLFSQRGVPVGVATTIYNLLLDGSELHEIREWLRANGLDAAILDEFDKIVDKEIGDLNQKETGIPSGGSLFGEAE